MDFSSSPTASIIHHVNIENSINTRHYTLDDALVEFALDQWQPQFKLEHDYSGWLNKLGKGSYFKKWQNRWLVLKDGSLFYFRRNTDTTPAGVLFIDSCSHITDVSDEIGIEFSFSLYVDSSCSLDSRKSYQRRTYHFYALDKGSFDTWMNVLGQICGNSISIPIKQPKYVPGTCENGSYSKPIDLFGRFGNRNSVSTIFSGSSSVDSSGSSFPVLSLRTGSNNTDSAISDYNGDLNRRFSFRRPSEASTASPQILPIASPEPPPADLSNRNRGQSQTLYSVFTTAKSQVSHFIEILKDALQSEKEPLTTSNYIDLATSVIRQVRQLLYFIDGRFTKNIQNSDLSGCISRQLSSVIDKIRQIGFHAKNLNEDEVNGYKQPSMIRELMSHLEDIINELHVLINVSKNIYNINLAAQTRSTMSMGMDSSIAIRIEELIQQAIEIAASLNAQSLDNALRYISVVSSFIKSIHGISLLVFSDTPPELHEINLNFENLHNRLILDSSEFRDSIIRLSSVKKTFETLSALVQKSSSYDSVLILSENYFSAVGFLLKYLVTLAFIERRYRGSTKVEVYKGLRLLCTSLSQLTLLPPPEDPAMILRSESAPITFRNHSPDEGFESCRSSSVMSEDNAVKTLGSSFRESMRLEMPISKMSFMSMTNFSSPDSEKREANFENGDVADYTTINQVVLRTVTELCRIAVESAKSLRLLLTSCTHILDNEASDMFSQYSMGMSAAAVQAMEELTAVEAQGLSTEMLDALEDSRRGLLEAVDSFSIAQRNWMSMISPSTSRSQMIDSTLIFESQCNRVLAALKVIVDESTNKKKKPHTPPRTPSSQVLGSIQERDEDEDRILAEAEVQIERILDDEHIAFEADPDLVFRTENISHVKGGTLEKLVENLTYYRLPSSDFTYAFLLTYRSFTPATDLLDLLIKRYNIEPPPALDEKVKSLYFTRKIIPIRLRVFNVLKLWIKNNFEDFESNSNLLTTLYDFLPTMRADFFKGTTDFKALLDRKRSLTGDIQMTPSLKKEAPVSLFPKNMESLDLLAIEPLELARQITLSQWDIFYHIKPNEFLNQSWNRKELHQQAKNLRNLIQFSNFLVQWISSECVSEESPKQRAIILKHFISTADKMRYLNNFEGLKCFLCGLHASGVGRLKKSWDLLPSKYKMIFDELTELMSEDKSCKNYRQMLNMIEPPCIPFIGVYLTDLTMIETGNTDYLKEQPNLINFHKRYLIAQVIQQFKQFQGTFYSLTRIEPIIEWIKTRNVLNSDEIYERSLIVEPRAPPQLQQLPTLGLPDEAPASQDAFLSRRMSGISKRSTLLLNFTNFRNSSA